MPYSAPGPFLGAQTASAYQISRSLRFRSSASAYLSRTPASAGSRTSLTLSAWIKRGALGAVQYIFSASEVTGNLIRFNADDTLTFYTAISGTTYGLQGTTAVFRDPSAWYHIVAVIDTNNATPADRMRLYVNNTRISTATTNNVSSITSGATTDFNQAQATYFSRYYSGGAQYLDGYLAEVNFIDGQALTPSSFGAFDTNGVWQPKAYTGTYGTNGFYLPFTDNTGTSANDFTYSQDLTNAIWTKSAGTASGDVIAAPDGTTTADKFTEDTTNAAHFYYAYFATGYQSVNVTYSLYVKAAGRSYALIELVTAAATLYAFVDLIAGTISSATSTGADFTNPSSSITSVGNGWYRISISATKGSANTNIYPEFFLCQNSSYTSSYTGDGTSGMYIWGQQLQKSLSAGYYRATTSAALTAATNIGADKSNGSVSWNFWTATNISTSSGTTYDSMIDSPTNYADGGNGRGNYCTLNPLGNPNSPITTISNGNLTFSHSSSVGNAPKMSVIGTFGVSTGKWYFEYIAGATVNDQMGISTAIVTGAAQGSQYALYTNSGSISVTPGTASGTPATYTTGDIIGVAFDVDAQTVTFYKNGVSQSTVSSIGANTWFPARTPGSSATGGSGDFNFGQQPFRGMYVSGSGSSFTGTGAPPSGFSALNTQNLPTPTIANGAQYMAATTYIGTSSSNPISNATNNTSGTTFQPDFVWIKNRNYASGTNHVLIDSVRGASLGLASNLTNADFSTTGNFSSINNNGFTVTGTTRDYNFLNDTFIGWQWNAGGAPTTDNVAGAGNVPTAGSVKINGANSTSTLAGSIAATRLSANTSAGFSVVTYTANGTTGTVGHGLGVTPSMIIVKARSSAQRWTVFHTSTSNAYLYLNETFAADTANAQLRFGNNTSVVQPTSSVFTIGNSTDVNSTSVSGTYVAYCFAPVSGYSAFGSFTANSSADGVFIYTGFRPRWIICKQTSGTGGNWFILDTSRNNYNVSNNVLDANLSDAERNANIWDILSNGMKMRISLTGDFIYAAFAENPFRIARAR